MSIAAAKNAGPGPCDLQDPLWVKMSAITGSITKKRKKSDAKPQSQINKCLNEKRRRTQENQYIDELAELISATDMSSGKTDKCQILQRTVDQIRHIKQQESSNSHAVQQGEVSSSNPSLISNDKVGPMLLEALDGFLFVVNTEGRVEYVTDNITDYINYTKDDVLGKDIYNIIHHGDHNTFMPSLSPMALGWTNEPQTQTKNRIFNCRFLVKPPDDKEQTMEQKQQRVNKYETMQICSALLANNSDRLESGDVSSESSDIGPCVMCVARKIPENEVPISTPIQQFTFKLDLSGKILALDNSWLSQPFCKYLNKDLIGSTIQDLCHPHDLSQLTAHLKGTQEGSHRPSPKYRLCLSEDTLLYVQANSRFFTASEMSGYDSDYVMCTNSILGPVQESQIQLNNVAGAGSNVNVNVNVSANGGGSSSSCKRLEDSKGCPSTSGTMHVNSAPSTPSVETQNSVVSTESGRLRNLLTKGASGSEDSQDNSNNDSGKQKHRILKTLLNQQDDDNEYHSEHNRVRTSPSSAPKPNPEQSNNMLLQLLNEKNDDDDEEARIGLKKSNELLQKLLKNQDDEKKQKEPSGDDHLLKSLGFQTSTSSPSQSNENSQGSRKRSGDDLNMNSSMKRPRDGSHPSVSGTNSMNKHLWEKNKMLASLLAKEPEQPTTIPPIPQSVISGTPQDKLPRVTDRLKQHSPQQQPWTTSRMQPVVSNTITTTATSARTPLQNLPRQQLPRQATNVYLSHMLSQAQQQRPQVEQIDSDFVSSGDYRQPNIDPGMWNNQTSDPDLNDILEQFVDFTDNQATEDSSETTNDLLRVAEVPRNNVVNETMAINAIQKSLMLIEAEVNSTSSSITMPGTPPAYSTALNNSSVVTTSQHYQAASLYQQQQQPRMRFNSQQGIRQTTAQFTPQQQLQLQQQRSKLIQQQQMKQRLLQQQQQQQLLIPSNATATDQINTGIHNIDSLLNNTVAPNVSLQRSSVSDSQVSPGYGGSVQMPSGHRLAHSYSHPSTLPQHPVNNNFNSGQQVSAPARLSPHSPAGILSFSHPQPLSPRVSQGNYGNSPRMFSVSQVRQQQQPNTQQQLQQQQRSMPSPGTPASARQSPFPAETFPPPASPTASQFPPVPIPNANNPSTQYRLQRTASTPSATTQLPGGIGSPRHYGGVNKEQALLSPSHPHSGCPATPTHNQHNVTNTQHFSNQQHSSMIYHNTANTINTADVQNQNQYCYDRTSVPLYQMGPGDAQDTRPLPPSNPASHQMGGNASSTGSMTSEFVRQELRAIVGARTQQQQQRVPNNLQNNLTGQVSQDDLDALGLTFEMSTADYYRRSGPR